MLLGKSSIGLQLISGLFALPRYGGRLHEDERLMPSTPMYGLMTSQMDRDGTS
jgi:hypothetical protein